MGLIDSISEGITKVVLFIVGLFVLLFGVIVGATGKSTITGIFAFIIVIVALGILYASARYTR